MTEQAQQDLYNNTVIRLISETGFPITLIKPNQGTYDPDTGFTPGVATNDEGFGLELETTDIVIPTGVAEKVLKTVMCIEIDKPDPQIDKIEIDSIQYSVLYVEPLKPGTVTFYYTVFLGV